MFLYRSLQKILPFLCGVFFGIFLFNSYHINSENAKEVRFIQQNVITEQKIKAKSKIYENEIKVATEHRERVQNVAVNIVPNVPLKQRYKTKVFKDIYSFDENEKDFSGKYWEMAPHYNVDDYGVPIEEYVLSVDNMKSLSKEDRLKKFKERNIKTVLYYHAAYGSKTYGFNFDETSKQGQLPYIMKGCRRRDCFCTDQRDFIPIEEFDAIVFYSRGIQKSDIPAVRKPHQRYILWEMEPVAYLISFDPPSWKNFFNWTHTYRRDSEMWEPWGVMNQVKPFPKNVDDLIAEKRKDLQLAVNKKKSVAWFVSNCNSRSGRENYIRELQKYITVDVYGMCGPLKCDRSEYLKCWDDVERDYYFYFSGENSLCKDYITEKFFNAMKRNILPIVFGGGQGTNDYYFAPKKSFINTYDYKSPKELAEYLLKLQKEHAEYVSYFWWKPYYNIWLGRWKKAHCEICDKLHANEPRKVYKDMQDWWVTQSKCRPAY
ncbi:alpha-(1,3)-fucosyltransferase C-like [Hydractinia symbiolongicarpus]|uniref:alpha-(1,3)-fucosyltransferase C-like n=1 Tax=Hydractinia symbiolongicarpus TaxID=13093 RepID=UPI00254CBB26|nr:alpha-(1,3)-fucosyltransferase C-like [Hydractinia symbiolongicarpus]